MLWQQGKAYSLDLQDCVFAKADDGARVGQTAGLLRESVSYVSKVLDRRRRQEKPRRGHSVALCARSLRRSTML
jgi:hypothetical protein